MKKGSNPMPPEGMKRPAPPPGPPPIACNHDKAKVTCSDCAREVERLREELEGASETRLTAFDLGWLMACEWSGRDDMALDMDSAAYQIQRSVKLREQG